jgi:hypothetical protein
MDVLPPPASGMRMQDLGDRMIVHFRPRRSWGTLAFLGVWLAFWTFGGAFAVYAFSGAAAGERLFLLVWLCGWVCGECFAGGVIAWQLFGRELLIVTPAELVVRKEVRRFARTKRYEAAFVRDITAALVPSDEDEKPRKDFCLRVKYQDRDVRIGEGMGEREAEYVASEVLWRIRPRSWWDEKRDVGEAEAEPMRRVSRVRAATIALPILALAAVLVFLLPRPHHANPRTARNPARTAHSPSPGDFQSPREYAAAMTSYVVRAGRPGVSDQPTCGRHVTWTEWTCRVRFSTGLGLPVPYVCTAVAAGGVMCRLATKAPSIRLVNQP